MIVICTLSAEVD